MVVTSQFCTIGGHFDPPVGDGNVLRSSTKLSARAKREVEKQNINGDGFGSQFQDTQVITGPFGTN